MWKTWLAQSGSSARLWPTKLSISSAEEAARRRRIRSETRKLGLYKVITSPRGSNSLILPLSGSWRPILKLNTNFLKSKIIDNLFSSNLLCEPDVRHSPCWSEVMTSHWRNTDVRDAADYSQASFLRLRDTWCFSDAFFPPECLWRNFQKLVFLIDLLVLPCTAMDSVEGL